VANQFDLYVADKHGSYSGVFLEGANCCSLRGFTALEDPANEFDGSSGANIGFELSNESGLFAVSAPILTAFTASQLDSMSGSFDIFTGSASFDFIGGHYSLGALPEVPLPSGIYLFASALFMVFLRAFTN
jgi:hypothetical protein